MPDISLSPVPYNGGTLLTGQYQNAHCMLQPGVFLHVMAQTNPSYIYAYVTTLTNYKTGTGTYSTVASPMRAILSPGSTPAAPTTLNAVRLYKLNNTTAAMLMNGTMYVLMVGAGNDVTLRAGTSLTLPLNSVTPNVQGDNKGMFFANPGFPASGSVWMFHYVRDNCLLGHSRGSATAIEVNSANGIKIVYDPTSGSLTTATAFGSTLSTSLGSAGFGNAQVQYCAARSHLMDIPGSTTKLFQYRVYVQNNSPNNIGLARSVVGYAAFVDSNNNLTALPLPPSSPTGTQNVTMMVPLAANRVLGFIDNKSYLIYNGTSWSTTPVVFATQTGMTVNNQYTLIEGVALDANYFALYTAPFSGSYDPGNGNTSNTWSMRIGRYVDAGLGQVSPNTANGDGVNMIGITNPMVDQGLLFRDGTDTMVWLLRDSSTQQRAAYKIQYQVGG